MTSVPASSIQSRFDALLSRLPALPLRPGQIASITLRENGPNIRAVFQGLSGSAIRHIANETMEISAGYQADRSGMGVAYGYELRELSDVLMALADVMEAADA